jgi:hypothetical protein
MKKKCHGSYDILLKKTYPVNSALRLHVYNVFIILYVGNNMPIFRKELKVFKTTYNGNVQREWTYHSPKKGGSNGAGEYGGFYECKSDSKNLRCLIKQDARIYLNIAEFLAGRIYQTIIPEVSAQIRLVRVDDNIQISSDGRNVYLLSEFIPGWTHDLYSEIQTSFDRSTEHSKYKFKEAMEVSGQLIFYPRELTAFFQKAVEANDLTNFGQVSATSLIINNTDTNLGNLGIIKDQDSGRKKLGVIDYGAAFRNMTPKINPHSFNKYLASHMLNREGGNNFMFYPESIKITSEFVDELDKASAIDLTHAVDEAFNEISTYFGIKPIVAFAVRAGVIEKYSDQMLEILAGDAVGSVHMVQQIKDKITQSMKARQCDLSRFSAQIKMDMCVHYDCISKEYNLDGSFREKSGNQATFNDVVFSHFDYFKEIVLGEEKFKFRQSTHKHQPKLIEEVSRKYNLIFASFMLAEENIHFQNEHNIHSIEDAVSALKKGTINKKLLGLVLDKKLAPKAKQILNTYEIQIKLEKLDTVKDIISEAGIELTDSTESILKRNTKLQDAIIELHTGCKKLSSSYSHKEKEALSVYKKRMIALALQGEVAFKKNYAAVEATAIQAIDHNSFTKFARVVGNLIWLTLAVASVVGAIALYYRSNSGGILLFKSPQQDISSIVSKFSNLQTDEDVSDKTPGL